MSKTRIATTLAAALLAVALTAAAAMAFSLAGRPQKPKLATDPKGPTCVGGLRCDPRALSGKITAVDTDTLTIRTDAGKTYSGSLTDDTMIACPPQRAIDAGRVFNPKLPALPNLSGDEPSRPAVEITDRYACAASELTVGRHVAGAQLAVDKSGARRWLGVAVAPS